MISGYIRSGSERNLLFSEGMDKADVLRCEAKFYLNSTDSAELAVPASNRPARSMLQKNSVVELVYDNETVFVGEVATVFQNELGETKFEIDGALGWLRSVCKAPFSIKPSDPNGSVGNFLSAIITQYNAAVGDERRLELGTVTVSGGVRLNHSEEYVDMHTLLSEVVDQLGGYVFVDYSDAIPKIHYVDTPTAQPTQTLEFGKNVLTVEDQLDFSNYASRVYATGHYYVSTVVDGNTEREQRLIDAGYVVDTDAEQMWGRSDIAYQSGTDMGGSEELGIPDKTREEALAIIIAEAQAILDARKVPLQSLTMTAVEFAEIGSDYRMFKVGTVARAIVQILGIDTVLAVRSVSRDFIDQSNSSVSFGREGATISGANFGGSGGASSGGAITSGVSSVNGRTGEVYLGASDVGAMPSSYVAPVSSVNGYTGTVSLSASDVGAMPNTYTAPVTSVNGMTGDVVVSGGGGSVNSVNGKTGVVVLTASDVGAVATESGKGLSTNDFTTAEKNKLSGIAAGAEVNVQADWNQTDSSADDFIKNKPSGVMLPPFSNSDAFKHLRVNYNGTDVEWFAESGDHTIFFMNESTLAIDGATGSDISHAILADFKSVYIVSNESYSGGVRFHVYQPLCDDAPTRDLESVQFYRPSTDGIVVLTIGEGQSVATKTTISFGSDKNVFYYLDGTTVKSAKTNAAVTGQQINSLTIANGLAPIIYQYDSANYVTNEFHFFQWHSGGLIFKTLDGKRQIFIQWGSSTATITQSPGYSANIVFYLDGTTVKYTGTNTAVTGNDVAAMTLANGNMPVIRQLDSNAVDHYYHLRAAHSGGMEFRLLDGTKSLLITYNSSTATIKQEYYAVTLNADGTVNTFDSALTYSAASSSVLNGTSKKLIVTWGNSIFTAEANEKLSGANGDVKFITDVEHDGIQRHMVFTLTSANALQTTLIETYARVPITVWEVADVTQGLIALNTNISSSLAWQLTGLNLSPFKRIKVYVKAGRKTGALSADSSITPASIIEMSMDDRAKENASQNVFIGSSVVQNPNDPNRLGIITCAVSGDKTKFAVVRATTLYGTAATSNTDAYPYVFKIEGYYD